MLTSNRFYYQFKPYLPWRLRMSARRLVARYQRRMHRNVWPINEATGHTPANWQGWPGQKKFALVLTHDVEGPRGLEKCRQLMALEKKYGFRSSFNFVPEGEYRVPAELRTELTDHGFEVGVHDLRHDGKLYWRPAKFSENARSINRYLDEWQASGFRSGFMLHDRVCLHKLNIQYDASTFDTDPFEPQPEGAHTIFPFWVGRGLHGDGYVELPYTLPQDSTLYLVLKEKSSAIWKNKLAWVAGQGGMALMNVHPDYLCFGKKPDDTEYPIDYYEEFLRDVTQNYAGQYWNALPREVAGWYRENVCPGHATPPQASHALKSSGSLRDGHAAVVLYSNYATDPRPRREAEALHAAGMEVDVICLSQGRGESRREKINGVNVFHVPLKRRRAGKLVYFLQYAWFLLCAFVLLSSWSLKKRYRLVHVHNMPDFLVFTALIPKWRGARIILDLHDPMPELFRSIYRLPENHSIIRGLKKMEKLSIAFAHLALTPNLAFKRLFVSRSCPAEKMQTVMNSPEPGIFNPQRLAAATRGEPPVKKVPGLFVLMYHGLLVERHGLDLAIHALARLRARIPGLQLHLYGEPTEYLKTIQQLVWELGLTGAVHYHGFKPLGEIAADISRIDLGLIPNRVSPFTQINFPTRIFEYLAMHKPVLVPATVGIRDYFSDDDMLFFEGGNVDDLAARIEWAWLNPQPLKQIVENGRRVYERNDWNLEREKFIGLVDGLLAPKATAPQVEKSFA